MNIFFKIINLIVVLYSITIKTHFTVVKLRQYTIAEGRKSTTTMHISRVEPKYISNPK